MSSLNDESVKLPSTSPSKHPRSDNVVDLPHSKKLRIADRYTMKLYIAPIDQDTRGFFDAIKLLPGEMRNRIYDAVLSLMRLNSATPLIQANKCTIRWGRKAKGNSDGRSQRECRQLLLGNIENCALRVVPGLREEFMARLWNAVNIRFCTFDEDTAHYKHDYTFLRAARVKKLTYQVHRYRFHARVFHEIFRAARPFVQALEHMEFYGTVTLIGWKYDVGIARTLVERVQKYWRLSNTVDAASGAAAEDGVWRLEIYPYSLSLLAQSNVLDQTLPQTGVDVCVDMRPCSRAKNMTIRSSIKYGGIYVEVFWPNENCPPDPFDGEPWCWQELINASMNELGGNVTQFAIKEGYELAKSYLRPAIMRE